MDERTADDQELRDLMRRYQSGDPIAIEHLVRRISPALLRYFAGSLSGRNEAEDLLQDTWLQIHKARHTHRPGEPVLIWIYAIARHLRVDDYRRSQRIRSREQTMDSLPEHPERSIVVARHWPRKRQTGPVDR